MTKEEIIAAGYKEHHTAARAGYESRKGTGHAETYKGRFGTGYKLIAPRYDTTRFVSVTYYIKEGEEE